LRLPIVLRGAPLGSDVPFLLELHEGGVERPVVDGETVAARLLDPAGDAVAVKGTQGLQGLQDHQRQGSLPDVLSGLFGHPVSYGDPIGVPMGKQYVSWGGRFCEEVANPGICPRFSGLSKPRDLWPWMGASQTLADVDQHGLGP